jgi:hypothetical protein
MNLNQTLRNDYYFGGEDGRSRQFGRVQAGELLSNIDSMEDELRRYYSNADDNYMIIEGIYSDFRLGPKRKRTLELPSKHGTTYTYRVTPDGFIFGEHSFNTNIQLVYAWVFRLSECGIVTFNTLNYIETARVISAIYANCQKPPESHNTLNRYYIPVIRTGETDNHTKKRISIREQNPFIRALMALSRIYRIDIGEKKAEALSVKFNSIYDLAFATTEEICSVDGIGKKTAEALMNAIGREGEP